MKFKEYTQELKNKKLSEQEKFLLYEKIFQPKYPKKLQVSRFSFSMRQLTYMSILVFLMTGIFGTYFLNTEKDFNPQFSIFSQPQNTVKAGYIANVVEFTGDFHIESTTENNNTKKTIKSSAINNNDKVFLNAGTILSFDVIDGTKVKIVGPAVFTLEKSQNNPYRLFIEKGEFTSIKNEQTIDDNENMEVIVDNNIAIKIEKEKADFQIAKKGNEYYINNQGKDLIVSNISKNKKEKNEQTLSSKKVLTFQLDNDISVIQDQKQFAKALATRDISQTFSLVLETEQVENKVKEEVKEIEKVEIDSSDKPQNDERERVKAEKVKIDSSDEPQNDEEKREKEISKEEINKILTADKLDIDTQVINTLLSGNKKVFSQEQDKQLKKSLNTFFVENNIRDISDAYLFGEQDLVIQGTKKLNQKFIALGKLFNINIQTIKEGKNNINNINTENFTIIKNNLKKINTTLKKEYYFPENYQENITLFIQWINTIEEKSFGSKIVK